MTREILLGALAVAIAFAAGFRRRRRTVRGIDGEEYAAGSWFV